MPDAMLSRRRALRRAVRFECQLQSDLWDGPVPFLVTDLSPFGMWLDSPLPLHPGERVVVAFRPPSWPDEAPALSTEARVARSGLRRRRADRPVASGMGLRFGSLDDVTRAALADRLRGLPPPLPGAIAPPLRLTLPAPEISECALELGDGLCFELLAEAPLLTAGRPQTVAALPVRELGLRGNYRYVPREQRLGLLTPQAQPPLPGPAPLRLVKG
jgi:hypothetical protein